MQIKKKRKEEKRAHMQHALNQRGLLLLLPSSIVAGVLKMEASDEALVCNFFVSIICFG